MTRLVPFERMEERLVRVISLAVLSLKRTWHLIIGNDRPTVRDATKCIHFQLALWLQCTRAIWPHATSAFQVRFIPKNVFHMHFLFSVFQQTNLYISKITLRYLILYMIHKVVERKIIEINLHVRESSVYVGKNFGANLKCYKFWTLSIRRTTKNNDVTVSI